MSAIAGVVDYGIAPKHNAGMGVDPVDEAMAGNFTNLAMALPLGHWPQDG